MKRTGTSYLKEQILSQDNLNLAFTIVTNKKKHWRTYKSIISHKKDILNDIIGNPYVTGNYRIKTKQDSSSGKIRTLMIAPVRDQILQHAVMNICHPFFQKRFVHETSCAIKNRGPLYASNLIRKAIKEGATYYAKLDIHHYFASISHYKLYLIIKKMFKDPYVLDFFYTIIYSLPGKYGIPLGNHTSQDLSNIYLTYIDRYIKETLKIKWYIRYNDDIVIIDTNEIKLMNDIWFILNKLNEIELISHGHEKVHKITSRYFSKEGCIDLAGWRIYSNCVIIRKRIWKKLRRLLIRQTKNISYNRSKRITSRLGYLKYSNYYFINKIYILGINNTLKNVRRDI
jgi:RNA-directed DNA polymerase